MRRRERLAAEALAQRQYSPQEPIPEESELTFQVVGQTTVDGENVVEAVTFYGESFQVWGESGSVQPDVNDAPPPALGLSESPQPAIDTDGAVADTESSHESSGDGVNHTVGFWRNGEWVPRPRTASERRQQRGGNGPQRAQRKQERLNKYFRGEWLPAWLEKYKVEKARREASAAPAEPDEEDDLGLWVQDNEAASSTTVAPEESQPASTLGWGDVSWTQATSWSSSSSWSWWSTSCQWEDWSASTCWDWSTSTSTSTSLSSVPLRTVSSITACNGEDLDLEEDLHSFMQLRNSERARMQEAGVPAGIIQRLEAFLQQLDDRQELYGTGAEGRWAVQCMLRRAQEAEEALGSILDVLADRLEPQGFWPIRRVPRTEGHRWVTFNWGRQLVPILVDCLQAHLDVRLQGEETAVSPVVTPPDAVAPSSHHSTSQADTGSSGSSNGQGAYSRRRRSDTVTSLASRAPDSLRGEAHNSHAGHSEDGGHGLVSRRRRSSASSSSGGVLREPEVFLSDSASELGPADGMVRGPPPPRPISASLAPTELQGIWREVETEAGMEDGELGSTANPASSSHDGPSSTSTWTLLHRETMTSTTSSSSLTATVSLTTSVAMMSFSSTTSVAMTSFSSSQTSAVSKSSSLSSTLSSTRPTMTTTPTTSATWTSSSTSSTWTPCTTPSSSTLSTSATPTMTTSPSTSAPWTSSSTSATSFVSTTPLSSSTQISTRPSSATSLLDLAAGLDGADMLTMSVELMQHSLQWDVAITSTSTSTSMVNQDDQVRDAVNRCALHCGRADLNDLLRRLQDRQRRLLHLQRLTQVALEELCTWFASPAHALPLNAGEAEEEIWGEISRHASAGGVGIPASSPVLSANHPTILVGPDMPSAEQILRDLPGRNRAQLASMRRRLWRRHVHGIWPESSTIDRGDEVLYMIQAFTDEELRVPDPGLLPERPHTTRLLLGQAARRRQHRPRPAPRLGERQVQTEGEVEGWEASSDVDIVGSVDASLHLPASSSTCPVGRWS